MKTSLDPRVKRLPKAGQPGVVTPKAPLDQFGTFEVFVQPQQGRPFQHEGIVHAPNVEMAFVLAKETFTRRFTCASLCVVETSRVFVSETSEGNVNAYDLVSPTSEANGIVESYEVYHLLRRGKQHVHVASVEAASAQQAITKAREASGGKQALNIWAVRTADIRFTSVEEMDLWTTLSEKKFRDATAYRGGEKLQQLLDRLKS